MVPTISPGEKSYLTTLAPGAGAGGDQPAGLYPGGGFRRSAPQKVMTAPKMIPKIMKVVRTPTLVISSGPPMPPMMAPAPNPRTTSPVMRPRLSGHHLTVAAIGVTYAAPPPRPPPVSATVLGPTLSCQRPAKINPTAKNAIERANGTVASKADHPYAFCKGMRKTLHAYRFPMQRFMRIPKIGNNIRFGSRSSAIFTPPILSEERTDSPPF